MKERITGKVGLVVGYNSTVDRDAVGQYTEHLYGHIRDVTETELDVELVRFRPESTGQWLQDFASIWKRFDLLHLQYPCEGWGTSIVPGVYPGLLRALANTKTKLVVTFHEWRSMHPLRKASVVPIASTADGVVFVSSHERSGFLGSPCYTYRRNKPVTSVIPCGPLVGVPSLRREVIVSTRSELLNWNGVPADILVGYFGFVYSWKQPEKMLAAIRLLHDQGVKARLVMAGDFLVDHSDQKKQFFSQVRALGLEDYVLPMGYVEDQYRLATVLSACNTVLLLFADGVSTRRSSFWYVLELGVPMVTTDPSFTDEFRGVLDLDALQSDKQVQRVDRAAQAEDVAYKLRANSHYQVPNPQPGLSPNWVTAAGHHISLYKEVLSRR